MTIDAGDLHDLDACGDCTHARMDHLYLSESGEHRVKPREGFSAGLCVANELFATKTEPCRCTGFVETVETLGLNDDWQDEGDRAVNAYKDASAR